ncbi:MAG: Ig-like domain-containing protein [Lachnobacterium sp.]|nr:Ig-like domain-containing protein [Lachnobacterium sp.]
MKKGRQIFLRKFLAVFLSISMIFGLLPGNLTVALAGDREENTTITGFVAVYPDWNDNGEPSFPTEPYYMAELGGEVQGARSDLYFGFIDEAGQFKKITDVSKITAGEGLKITKQTNESGNESEDLFTVSFGDIGQHALTYNDGTKTYTINVNVVENRIKIYEDADHKKELARDAWGSYLWDNDDEGHSAECTEVYVVIKPNADEVIETKDPFDFSGGTDKLSIEKLTGQENEYKITRTEGSISCEPFPFKIKGHMGEDAQNTFEQEIQLCVHFQGAGLRVTSELKRDEYDNVTGVEDGAAWDVGMGCDLNGTEACFGIVDANGSCQKKVTADQLEIYEAHEGAEGAIIPDTNPTENASITQNDNEEWVSLHFKKEGVYVIQLKHTDDTDNNKVDVWVSMPNVGFYSRPEISADAYLAGDVAFGKNNGDNVLYLIARDDDYATYNQAKEAVFSCDGNSSEAVCNLFIDVEKIEVANAAKAYKVTIKKNKNFHLEAHCEYQTTDPQGTFDNYARNLSLQYQGDQPDQGQEEAPNGLWRYEGEDGEDYIGYSGRYITKEAYLKGTIWFEDATPESICYWVHGKTIQEVVDKLLELEDQNVTVWDSVAETETEVTIHNSGFIYLNMSYRDSRYKDAVEEEQYVYAPASVKGVMLDTASNSYSVALTSPDGSVHQDKENDNKPIYDTVYEFPLTKAAQSSMKQYNLAGIESEVDYDSIGNDGIQYLHGIVLQDWYLSKEDGYGNELKKLLELQNDANKNLGADQQSSAKRIIQKTIYDASTDSWSQTDTYYLISDDDIKPDDNDGNHHVEQYAVFQKEQHRWPSLHVNASTQVRVLGLWTNNANLYIGFYDGVDSVSTYIGKDDEGRDIASFSPKDIGETKNVKYSCRSVEYDPSLNRNGDEKTNEDNHVTVHVVKAESNTKINDTYSEGGKSASIDVEKEAISDLVPMTKAEKEALIDGASLDLELKVSGVENSADADVVKAQQDIKSVLGLNKKADFFNAFLNYTLKKSDGTAVADNKMITEAEEEMVLSFPLKEALQGKKNYVVYRYHDGKAEKLNAWIDKTTGNLCFETDRFSVYAIAVDDETSGGSSSGGGSVSGGGSSAGGGTVMNPDNKTEDTKTEVKPDGTKVETKTDTVKNDQGNEVKSETTTIKNADGTVASVTTTIEIKDAATNTTINMVVKKDAAGEVTEAKAEIEAVAAAGKNGKAKTTLNADATEQMIQAAGTKNVTIKQTVRDDKGNTLHTVETDAKNLEAGRKLTLVEIRDGKQILVAKSAKVDTNGNFTIRAPKGEYQLLNETQMKTLRKQILAMVKPAKKSVSIKKGKKAAISLSKKLDKANVAKITYRSTKKSVVTITKNGKATGKKKGAAVIEITVVLNDGTKKVIKTKVTVK